MKLQTLSFVLPNEQIPNNDEEAGIFPLQGKKYFQAKFYYNCISRKSLPLYCPNMLQYWDDALSSTSVLALSKQKHRLL